MYSLLKKIKKIHLNLFWQMVLSLFFFTFIVAIIWYLTLINQNLPIQSLIQNENDVVKVFNLNSAHKVKTINITSQELSQQILNNHNRFKFLPRNINDKIVTFPINEEYFLTVKNKLGLYIEDPSIILSSEVNGIKGIWISFTVNETTDYWLLIKDTFSLSSSFSSSNKQWLFYLLLCLLLIIWLFLNINLITKPIKNISKAANLLSQGQKIQKLPENTGIKEICELNKSFNQMAQTIEENDYDRSIMLAGLSHDLRTPLSRMRLEIEMSGISDDIIKLIDEDLSQVEHCIRQFSHYARPIKKEYTESIDISLILKEIIKRYQNDEKIDCIFTTNIQPNLHSNISYHSYVRILKNIIINAIKYGKSDDNITYLTITAQETDKHNILSFKDNGNRITEEEVARFIQPFVRGNESRSGTTGTGLGLTIVQRLANQYDGSMQITPNPTGGLTINILLLKS